MIRSVDGRCLQPGAAGGGGGPLVGGLCGGPDLRWIYRGFFPDRITLEHVASGLCAGVEGGAAGNGTPDSGLFWFFTPGNDWEMLIKVLDGCAINGHHWVFASATTTVEYTLRVTDTETGRIREYFNPLGRAAPAITDTSAFAGCP